MELSLKKNTKMELQGHLITDERSHHGRHTKHLGSKIMDKIINSFKCATGKRRRKKKKNQELVQEPPSVTVSSSCSSSKAMLRSRWNTHDEEELSGVYSSDRSSGSTSKFNSSRSIYIADYPFSSSSKSSISVNNPMIPFRLPNETNVQKSKEKSKMIIAPLPNETNIRKSRGKSEIITSPMTQIPKPTFDKAIISSSSSSVSSSPCRRCPQRPTNVMAPQYGSYTMAEKYGSMMSILALVLSLGRFLLYDKMSYLLLSWSVPFLLFTWTPILHPHSKSKFEKSKTNQTQYEDKKRVGFNVRKKNYTAGEKWKIELDGFLERDERNSRVNIKRHNGSI